MIDLAAGSLVALELANDRDRSELVQAILRAETNGLHEVGKVGDLASLSWLGEELSGQPSQVLQAFVVVIVLLQDLTVYHW